MNEKSFSANKIVQYSVIGIPNQPDAFLSEEVKRVIPVHRVFSGGKRHQTLVAHLLPASHQWIDIGGNMADLFTQYRHTQAPIVIFASGDPLFYGIVQTIQKHDPAATIILYPSFNSVQRLCAKICQPYERVKNTSVHGRDWQELDQALLNQEPMIAVLTDRVHTPAAIADRMLTYHFIHYEMVVGEDLDGKHERLGVYTLEQAKEMNFHELNCVLLRQTKPIRRSWGMEDALFEGLAGRPHMITKKAIRLASLSKLHLESKNICWDIGFCTGSVAIEAKRQFPHLRVLAFEKRAECGELLDRNTKKLSTPGIEAFLGDFFAFHHSILPKPDAVFIGGHGNRLADMMNILHEQMTMGGQIAMNAVLESSRIQFIEQAHALGWQLEEPEKIQLDHHNPIWILSATKK